MMEYPSVQKQRGNRTYSQPTHHNKCEVKMKTIRKVIQETVNQILDERGLLAGDLSEVIADRIWAAIQERKDRKGEACPAEWVSALMKLCGASPYTATVALRSQISDCGKALIQSGAELADLASFSDWWSSDSWRASNIRYPSPKQIRDTWGKFLNERGNSPVEPIPAARASFSQRL